MRGVIEADKVSHRGREEGKGGSSVDVALGLSLDMQEDNWRRDSPRRRDSPCAKAEKWETQEVQELQGKYHD